MIARVGAALASLAILAVVFVPLERAFPARAAQRYRRRDIWLDTTYFFGQYLIWSVVAFSVLGAVAQWLRRHELTVAPLAALPVAAQVVLGTIAGDLLVYWFHRACHRYDALWRFHAVHHSVEELDFVAAHREHPLDGICTQLCQNLPLMIIGVPLGAVAGLATFRVFWAALIHSNVKISLGPFGILFGSPTLHHWHHARGRTVHNFANLAPWLDVLFGTHHAPAPEIEETYPLGLSDVTYPRTYLGQMLRPLRGHVDTERSMVESAQRWSCDPRAIPTCSSPKTAPVTHPPPAGCDFPRATPVSPAE